MIKIEKIKLTVTDTDSSIGEPFNIIWDSKTKKWLIETNESIAFYPRVIKALTEIYEIVREINRNNEPDNKDGKI